MAKTASLTSGLVAKKGQAAPAVTHQVQPQEQPAAAKAAGPDYDKALTVKLDRERYEALKTLGVKPLARIHHLSLLGHDPVIMLEAPLPASERALKRAGMSVDDIDLFEVNEAFGSVPVAYMKQLGVARDKINVNGGAIALGHPLGASGTKLMATLLNALEQRGGRYGLQTMCEGGGMANVTIVERL